MKELNDQTDRLFVESYKHIQEGLLQIEQVGEGVGSNRDEVGEVYFEREFFPKIRAGLKDIVDRYRDTES